MIARIVVAGTSSGAGKTTVACGLHRGAARARARRAGLQGRPRLHRPQLPRARLGPARAATSTPSSAARSSSRRSCATAAAGADIAVVEGVMGLFDGASGRGELASTAHVAKLLQAPGRPRRRRRRDGALGRRDRPRLPHLRPRGRRRRRDLQPRRLRPPRGAAARGDRRVGVPVLGALRRDDRRRRARAPPRARAGGRARAAQTRAALDALARGRGALRRPRRRAAPRPRGPAGRRPGLGGRAERRAGAGARSRSRAARRSRSTTRRTSSCCAPPAPSSCRSTRSPTSALPEGAGALVLAGGFPEVFGAELEANAGAARRGRGVRRSAAGRSWPSAAACCTCAPSSTGARCAACCPRAGAWPGG